jgi:hypothetical protein
MSTAAFQASWSLFLRQGLSGFPATESTRFVGLSASAAASCRGTEARLMVPPTRSMRGRGLTPRR